jgi:hypothetical protein
MVIPFARILEKKIKELDSLFFTREVWVDIDGNRTKGIDMGLTIDEVFKTLLDPNLTHVSSPEKTLHGFVVILKSLYTILY